MTHRGIDAFLAELEKAGVSRIFGNPGTTELPLNDTLIDDDRFEYVLGLHEGPVMAMADGYAMASRSLGVVNLHASCGLGNAMGQLYNAFREHTPLLVTAGQQDRRLRVEDPILAGDLVAVATPWTKYAAEVQRVEDLGPVLRRAIRAALTPPHGPVFVSLPIDVQLELCPPDSTPTGWIDSRVRPPQAVVERAVELLENARAPVILAGSRVCDRDAFAAVAELAERLGAPVFQESTANHGRLGLASDHPLRAGILPLWSPDVRKRLQSFDAAVVVGMDLMRQYVYFEPANPLPESLTVIHLDEDSEVLGKNVPTELGVLGDIRESLTALNAGLPREGAFVDAAQHRGADWRSQIAAERNALRDRIAADREQLDDGAPLPPHVVMGAVADALPADAAVVEEAVTTTNGTLEQLGALRQPDGYFAQRGWTLGWGVGCAIGAKFAWPERSVAAIIGDGSFMYGAPALWTAARHRLPLVVVLCNNRSYAILKSGGQTMKLPQATQSRFLAMDLDQPQIEFAALARSIGAAGIHVDSATDLTEAIRTGFQAEGPTLIEVPIADETWSG